MVFSAAKHFPTTLPCQKSKRTWHFLSEYIETAFLLATGKERNEKMTEPNIHAHVDVPEPSASGSVEAAKDRFEPWGFTTLRLLSRTNLPVFESFPNALVVELQSFSRQLDPSSSQAALVNHVLALSGRSDAASIPSPKFIWNKASALTKHRSSLKKSAKRDDGAALRKFDIACDFTVAEHAHHSEIPPVSVAAASTAAPASTVATATGVTSRSSTLTEGAEDIGQFEMFGKSVTSLVQQSLAKEVSAAQEKVAELEKSSIPKEEVKNLIRREKRKSAIVLEQRTTVKRLRKESEKALERSEKLEKEKASLSKKAAYWQDRARSLSSSTEDLAGVESETEEVVILQSMVKELKAELVELKDVNAELVAKVEELSSSVVTTMVDNEYTDAVRICCMELLSRNVSISNVEPVIRSVLKLANKTAGRLPQHTRLGEMFVEKSALAHAQLAEVLPSASHATLHSDGTTKHGQKYVSYQVSVGEDVFSLGMREILSGSAQTTLDTLIEVTEGIGKSSSSSDVAKKIIGVIKNTMSDRHIVQKKFNELLESYRREVLPTIQAGWDSLSEEEQASLTKMNNLYCGMHFVVNLAETVSSCLELYDRLHFENSPAGAALLVGNPAFHSKEAGGVRLVRSACKALQKHGSEQSGHPQEFAAYLSSVGISKVPLDSFRGNRFNILFHNAAGLFYVKDHVSHFLENVFGKGNKLLQAVAADMKEPVFLAEVRALGLIDKHLTTPLWNLLEDKSVSIISMSEKYSQLLTFLENEEPDHVSKFLTGEAVPFPDVPIKKDDKWVALVEPQQNDADTEAVLRAIFASFATLTRRLLADHLPGGDLDRPSESLQQETSAAAKTNTVSERDFAMLDRLVREKPNASTAALEGIILFNNNRTASWLAQQSNERQAELLKEARQMGSELYLAFRQRRKQMQADRIAQLRKKEEELEKKRQKEIEKKEKLTAEIAAIGLWTSPQEVSDKLEAISGAGKKTEALKTQLKFRRSVLAQNAPAKLFQFSSGGKNFTVDELKSNLLQILGTS